MNSTADKVLGALRAYNLKQEGSGSNKYRCNSPLRPGSNSHAFTVTIDGPENGAYFDHVSEDKGSLYDLAKLLNIGLPTVAKVENTKRSYHGMEDYAKAHGLSGEILRAWMWREEIIDGRPALIIPTQTGERMRFIDGKKPYYKSTPGYKRCWYGFKNVVLNRLDQGKPLVICNGEISTIAGQEAGFAAIAMTGGEKGEIPAELLEQLRGKTSHLQNLQIVLAMDCDEPGRRAARGIERQLKAEGFNVRAVNLELSTGGDLADFAMLYTDQAVSKFESLPGLPIEIDTENRNWKVKSLNEMLKMPLVEWLIPKQIPARGLTMLYGQSGVFKSFLGLHYSMVLAANMPVVYVAAEGEYGYRQRLEAWMKHFKKEAPHITFVTGQVDMFDEDDMYAFTSVIEQYKPRMIVVDTLSMCSGDADENNTRDMKKIVDACKLVVRTIDCCIVLVHHTNKEGKKERGSYVLRAACDTVIRMSRGDDVIIVESEKTKDASPFKPFYLKEMVIPLGYKNNLGEDVSSLVLLKSERVIRPDALTDQQIKVLEALSIEPDARVSEIASITEIGVGIVSKIVKRLTQLGMIQVNGSSRLITDKGEAALKDSSDSNDSGDSSDSRRASDGQQVESVESMESAESLESVKQGMLFDAPTRPPETHYDRI